MLRPIAATVAATVSTFFLVPSAAAEPAGVSEQDQLFLFLMQDEPQNSLVVANFPLIRAQALEVCRNVANGMSGVDAADQLAAAGPYSWDDASSIAAAAEVAYCP